MAEMTTSKEKMLKTVQVYSFALTEASLFLDTHPDCREALEYYNKYKALCSEAKAAYEEKYGPLTINSDANSSTWKWAKTPWPWEICAYEEA